MKGYLLNCPMAEPRPYTYQQAWNYALWLLSRQAYTTAQLKARLHKKHASPEMITAVIEKLEEMKFIDDHRYAEQYILSRQHSKGKLKLRQELFQKGLDETLMTPILENLSDEQQIESAAILLNKQCNNLQKTDPRKRYAKAYAFLARRGFSGDIIRNTIEQSKLFET